MRDCLPRLYLFLSLLCFSSIVSAWAQKAATPIPSHAFTDVTGTCYYGDLTASSDGRFIAYTLQNRTGNMRRDASLDGMTMTGCTIWVADLRTGNTHALVGGTASSLMPAWSPDGTKLAFYSNRAGGLKVWIWNRLTGALHPLTDALAAPFGTAPQWTPEGTAIIAQFADIACQHPASSECTAMRIANGGHATTNVPFTTLSNNGATAIPSKPIVFAYTPASTVSPMAAGTDPTFRPFYPGFVGIVKIAHASTVRRLGPDDSVVNFTLSPDGVHLAFTHVSGHMKGPAVTSIVDLDIADIRTGNYHTLVKGIRSSLYPRSSWSASGRHLGYITATLNATMPGVAPKIYRIANIVDIASGSVVKQSFDGEEPFLSHMLSPRWSSSSETAYVVDQRGLWRYDRNHFTFVAQANGNTVVDLVLNPHGTVDISEEYARSLDVVVRNSITKRQGIERVMLDSRTFSQIAMRNIYLTLTNSGQNGVVALPDKSFAMVAEDAAHPAELWIVDASGTLHQIGETNPQLRRYAFGTSTLLEWRSKRGELLQGSLLLPVHYQSGHRYPLVVFVYGFTKGSDAVNRFGLAGFNMQLLASRGYAVLYPDAPIREGYHREDVTDDVVSGVEAAVHAGYADSKRVAVMGQSAGGYAVAAIITNTTAFKAAIMIDGVSDLMSYYLSMGSTGNSIGINWLEVQNGAIGTTPWAAPDRYIANSPVLHLDRVQTPLLILQGTIDDDVPLQQADEMFVGLRRLNKEVTYVRYPGEGHVELDYTPAHQQDWWNRIFAWLDRHLHEHNNKPEL